MLMSVRRVQKLLIHPGFLFGVYDIDVNPSLAVLQRHQTKNKNPPKLGFSHANEMMKRAGILQTWETYE